jgi:hypothetical protein
MALVKIKDVYLYVGLSPNGAECYNAKKVLDDNNIPFVLLGYNDTTQHSSVFEALNTWGWGPEKQTKTFTDFPLIHWTECYDDFTTEMFCATSVAELNNSSLILNKLLVEPKTVES